jgi:hypothetical protein
LWHGNIQKYIYILYIEGSHEEGTPIHFFENDAECAKTFGKNLKKWLGNIHAKISEVL